MRGLTIVGIAEGRLFVDRNRTLIGRLWVAQVSLLLTLQQRHTALQVKFLFYNGRLYNMDFSHVFFPSVINTTYVPDRSFCPWTV